MTTCIAPAARSAELTLRDPERRLETAEQLLEPTPQDAAFNAEGPLLAKTETTAEELFSLLAAETDEEETAEGGHRAHRGG